MSLSIAILFDFDQHLSEAALTASRVGYRGLLRVLRAHPRLKFNLHLSGTLIHALGWLDPETLDLVRAGVAAGQFELLAGPYAHHVMCAVEAWDNAKQIALHGEALQAAFGAPLPVAFWNPGGCWRPALVPPIADAGCRWLPVEDHILHAAGAQDPLVFTTRHAGRSLNLLYVDSILRARVTYAAWTGRRKQAFDYLGRVAERPSSSRFCLVCALPAEAMGLWNWQAGLAPQAAWANLDAFLTDLEGQKWLKAVRLSRAPRPAMELTPVGEGSGADLDRALTDPDAPGYEAGYAGWNDFAFRAPRLARFNGLYGSLRTRIRRIAGDEKPTPADPEAEADYTPPPATRSPLLRQAIHVLCAYQHCFGVPGVGKAGYRGWEGARSAFALIRAAELAAKARSGLWVEDANGDGLDEMLLCDGQQLAVFTTTSGRLLYWFDLAGGRQWIGNQLAVADAPFQGDSYPPQWQARPREWWPESDSLDLGPSKRLKVKEAPPTRLGKYLPEWVWERAPRQVTWYEHPPAPEGEQQPRRVGHRALNDRVVVDGDRVLPLGLGDYRVEGDSVAVSRFMGTDFVVVKRLRLAKGGVLVQYRLENRAETPRVAELIITNELCPDYAEVLSGGRDSLEHVMVDDVKPGVRNTRTGRSVVISASRPWLRCERAEGLLALEVTLAFGFELVPQTAQTFDVRLTTLRFQPGLTE